MRSASELGELLRAVRKRRRLTLDDVYAATSLSLRFLSELERGKPNASLGKALLALQSLGLDVVIVPRAHTAAIVKHLADRLAAEEP